MLPGCRHAGCYLNTRPLSLEKMLRAGRAASEGSAPSFLPYKPSSLIQCRLRPIGKPPKPLGKTGSFPFLPSFPHHVAIRLFDVPAVGGHLSLGCRPTRTQPAFGDFAGYSVPKTLFASPHGHCTSHPTGFGLSRLCHSLPG